MPSVFIVTTPSSQLENDSSIGAYIGVEVQNTSVATIPGTGSLGNQSGEANGHVLADTTPNIEVNTVITGCLTGVPGSVGVLVVNGTQSNMPQQC